MVIKSFSNSSEVLKALTKKIHMLEYERKLSDFNMHGLVCNTFGKLIVHTCVYVHLQVEKYFDNQLWQRVSTMPEGFNSRRGDVCSINQNIFLMGVEALDKQNHPIGLCTVHRLDVQKGDRLICEKPPTYTIMAISLYAKAKLCDVST